MAEGLREQLPEVSRRFQRSAAAYSGLEAVDLGTSSVTFAQLAEDADAWTRRLTQSVGARTRIGLRCAHSAAFYAAYLGILQAGCTVVPLGEDWPRDRIQHVLDEARVTAVIEDDNLRRLGVPPATQPTGEAYLLFTSGSTGVPKGVPVRHDSLSALLDACLPLVDIRPGDRLSHTYPLTFDVSVFDMFSAWLHGATLVVPRLREHWNPVSYVNARRLTHWSSVPSMIAIGARLGNLTPGSMPGLRSSIFAGEELRTAHAHRWHQAAPNSTVTNAYGPTEMTIFSTTYRVPDVGDDDPATVSVPIGTPLPGVLFDVIDEAGRSSSRGELVVGGRQRFDGYDSSEHNEGHFVEPIDESGREFRDVGQPGASSYYRTGDVVVRVGDSLTYLGRVDRQVKLRGRRIELPEVEAALERIAGVEEAHVVVAFANDVLRAKLVAFVRTSTVSSARLQRLLRDAVPEYMSPADIRRAASFALSANGKIDHAALVREAEQAPA